MHKPTVAQKTVLETILEWSQGRPLWQRDALRRIIAQGRMTQEDVVELCKVGHGALAGQLVAVPLAKEHLPATPGEGAALTLVSVAAVRGANNLAPGQTLDFEPKGITIIYGDNGAGKSGYQLAGAFCSQWRPAITPRRASTAFVESGTVLASPFFVLGRWTVCRFKSTLSHSKASNSPRRMAVSIASCRRATNNGLATSKAH